MRKLMIVFAAMLMTACTTDEIVTVKDFADEIINQPAIHPAENKPKMGYKRLYTYGGFTAAELKARASIPSQADITVGADYIDCASVDIPTEIRDVIGEASNDLGTIYCSAKVNKWSHFGVWLHAWLGDTLVHTLKSNPYDMSNFCGYNHNAKPPVYFSSVPAQIEIDEFGNGTLNIQLAAGEDIPVAYGAVKTNIDIHVGEGNYTPKWYGDGSIINGSERDVTIDILYAYTGYNLMLWANYREPGGAVISRIEDDIKIITVVKSQNKFTGVLSALQDRTQESPFIYFIEYTITRVGAAGTLNYARLKVEGEGIATVYIPIDAKAYSAGEVFTYRTTHHFSSDAESVLVSVSLQYDYGEFYPKPQLMDAKSFTWTKPEVIN